MDPVLTSGDLKSPLGNKSVEVSVAMFSAFDTDPAFILKRSEYLSGAITRIVIYENIFSPTLTGEVEMLDSANMSSRFMPGMPALGMEQFAVSFGVYNPRTHTKRWYGTESPLVFAAYGQSHRVPVSQGGHTLRLKLASWEFMASLEHRISQKYPSSGQAGISSEAIIREILTKRIGTSKKFEDVEPTGRSISLTVPFLTPIETIRLVALQSQNATRTSNYLFYESLDGFHFKTISKMIEDGNNRKAPDGALLIPTIHMQLRGQLTTRADDTILTADKMDLVSGYNNLYAVDQGYFGATTYAVDLISGLCKETVSRASDAEFLAKPLVNGPGALPFFPVTEGMFDPIGGKTKIYVVPTTHLSAANSSIIQKDSSISSNYMAETLANRTRELTALQLRTIRVLVAGAPELTAGSLVDIIFPNPVPKSRGLDIASGRYLIVAARHTISRVSMSGEYRYETLFEACTDSHATSMRPTGG